MRHGFNCSMNLFSILNDGKNLSRKGMMHITQKMQSLKCLYHGRTMNNYRLQFCHLERFVNFY